MGPKTTLPKAGRPAKLKNQGRRALVKTGEQEPDVHSGWAPEIISGDGTTIRCGHMEASPQTRHIRESPLLPCSSLISSEPWLQVRLSVSSVVCSWSSSFSSCCLMLSVARLFSCSSAIHALQLAHGLHHLCVALPQTHHRVRLSTQKVVGFPQLWGQGCVRWCFLIVMQRRRPRVTVFKVRENHHKNSFQNNSTTRN